MDEGTSSMSLDRCSRSRPESIDWFLWECEQGSYPSALDRVLDLCEQGWSLADAVKEVHLA